MPDPTPEEILSEIPDALRSAAATLVGLIGPEYSGVSVVVEEIGEHRVEAKITVRPRVAPASIQIKVNVAEQVADFPELGDYVQVVTRYGGHRHLARKVDSLRFPLGPRYQTMCRGTSSWTLQSWEATPDHPQGLSVDDMRALPACPQCLTLVPL